MKVNHLVILSVSIIILFLANGCSGGQDYTDECLGIEEELAKDECYFDSALNQLNHKACGEILDIDERNYCYQKVAIEKEDLRICEKSLNQNLTDECYSDIAHATEDYSICNKVVSQKWKEYCGK
jgi:hypothetical protein